MALASSGPRFLVQKSAIRVPATCKPCGVSVILARGVQGDTMPRPILIMPVTGNFEEIFQDGYAVIGVVSETAESGQIVFKNYIGER
jgi:hypothetical protein